MCVRVWLCVCLRCVCGLMAICDTIVRLSERERERERERKKRERESTHVHVHVYKQTYVQTWIHASIPMHTHENACIHANRCIDIRTCTYACVHAACKHSCMHKCIHIYADYTGDLPYTCMTCQNTHALG